MSSSASKGVHINISALLPLSSFYHIKLACRFPNLENNRTMSAPSLFLKNLQTKDMRLSSPRFSSHGNEKPHVPIPNTSIWRLSKSAEAAEHGKIVLPRSKRIRCPATSVRFRWLSTHIKLPLRLLPSLSLHTTVLTPFSKTWIQTPHGSSRLPVLSHLEYLQDVHVFYPTSKNSSQPLHVQAGKIRKLCTSKRLSDEGMPFSPRLCSLKSYSQNK